MRKALTIETRLLPSGGLEVLLEKQSGDKRHCELITLPENETTAKLLFALKRMP